MKIIFFILIITLNPTWILAQNQASFDQLSFAEPTNWTFADNGLYHTYLNKNYASNIFCIISVYASDASSGNPEQDFQSEWKRIINNHFTTTKIPQPQKNRSASGIPYLQDEAAVSDKNNNYFAHLSVFNINGKMQSVLFLAGNKTSLTQYQPDLDRFLASLQYNNAGNTANIALQNTDVNDESASGTIHFNHIFFTVPTGWKAMQTGSFYSMTPVDITGEEQLIFLLFPPVSDTSFKNVGDAAIRQLAATMGGQARGTGRGDGSVYEVSYEGLFKKGWEYSMGSGTIQVNNMADYSKSTSFIVGVFLAKINGRIERVLYLSKSFKCDGVSTTSSYKSTFEPVITNFFFDLRFDDWKDVKVTQGKVTHSGISYVWSGTSYMTKGLNTMGTYDASFFILFDNGQAYYNTKFPLHGLLNLNTLAEAANNQNYWGTYAYQNGSGSIRISYRTIPFTIKGDELVAEMNATTRTFVKLPDIDDAHLEGVWCSSSLNGCISFTKDGKFSDNGVVGSLEHLPTSCNSGGPQKGEGAYEIKSHSLLFKYSNGLIMQTAISGLNIEKTNTSPDKLFLGPYGDLLQKK
jgi:hypothetical protein